MNRFGRDQREHIRFKESDSYGFREDDTDGSFTGSDKIFSIGTVSSEDIRGEIVLEKKE